MDLHQLEAFSLAEDRAKALEQLIPGTEDYYFYSCLHHEQRGELDEVQALLDQWNKRHGETQAFREIHNRLTLLRYGQTPKETLEYLRDHLGLSFDHSRGQEEGARTRLATRMDPKALVRSEIRRLGLSHSNSSDLSGFKDRALDWLLDDEKLEGARLRALLSRLRRPDHPRLVSLVAAELKDRHSSGFGAIAIHNLLLEDQLEELLGKVPDLARNERYVRARLAKLRPGPDEDWQLEPAARQDYLDRLWDFADDLAPCFNSLKAHVLFHRLDHDRRQGTYDRERFLAYAKLPRQVAYASPKYLDKFRSSDEPAFSLGQDWGTMLPAVGSDELLVRDYLARFFLDAKDLKPFDTYMADGFLKEVFATAKVLGGVGDMEKWYSMLDNPGFYQALKDRVELEFAPTNKSRFRAGEPVALDVKNVPTLVVKVFEINALNYFLANGREVDTSVDLDGLVASEEQTYRYSEPPLRRVRRTFDFPSLSRPGVFVVEFIGGGISSRSLVHKGRLRCLERTGAAGHVFTVLDQDRRPLPEATLWLGGREYRPDQDGVLRVPFSTSPGRVQFLMRHGAVTTLEAFQHQAESYSLVAGLYCDRESLLKKREAQVIVRPSLQVNGVPASLELLEEVALVIQSTDRDGVGATLEVKGFALHEDRESVHVFQVPENLASLSFTLRGKVKNLSQGRTVDLADSRSFALNGIDTSASIDDVHLSRTADGFVAYVLGKTGEPKPNVAVNVTLAHRELTATLLFTLQTDEAGRIELGHLRDVETVTLATPSGLTESWPVAPDRCRRDAVIHVRAGEAFRVPFADPEPLGAAGWPDAEGKAGKRKKKVERSDACLLERRANTYAADRFDTLSLGDGFLEIAGLPAGDYELFLKQEELTLSIRAVPGVDVGGVVAGEKRHAERAAARPVQLAAAEVADSEIRLRLSGAGPNTRVHVFGTRFVPAHDGYAELARAPVRAPRALELSAAPSHYVSGRDLGDEVRYVLERRFATKFPGNMLARPGLLLNPWAVRTTSTTIQEAATGGDWAPSPQPAMAAPCAPPPPPRPPAGQGSAFANLDFLAKPAAVLPNLVPDEDGVVRVPRQALAHVSALRVVVVAPQATASRDVLLPEPATQPEDLRLRLALPANEHFSEKKEISVLAEKEALTVADITTSKVEVYDSLAKAWRLFSTLSGNPELAKFSFVLSWPGLSEEEKRAKYSEFACHELSFFLYRKAPAFFEEVVKPYLRNKRDKTFMDHYLLGGDLSGYRKPWAFGRLNVVERILLSKRIDDEGEPVARHARELDELLPRDLEHADQLFRMAIQSSALEGGDDLGIAKQGAAVEQQRLADLGGVMGELASATRGGGGFGGKRDMAPGGPPSAKPRPSAAARAPARSMAKMAKEKARSVDDEAEADGFAMAADEPEPCKAEECMAPPSAERADLDARRQVQQFFQQVDKTQEWAENDYWQLTRDRMGPELVSVNPFWRDFAAHRSTAPFLSKNLAYACRSFTEVMLALAVLDLPFESSRPEVAFQGAKMTLTGKGRGVAFHKEIKPAEPSAERVPVLVSQNYFRDDDRRRYVDGEEVDRYVSGEFLVNVVYSCRVVLTNPTSTNQKLDLLLQIPRGAVPVRSGFYTQGKHLELSAYATESLEYAFYFPAPGKFPHFPVHVAKNEKLVAFAEPAQLEVVTELSVVDKESWAWVSQHGSTKDVLGWLERNNVERIARSDERGVVGLDLVAWRMRDRAFYDACLSLLEKRHVWSPTLWAYAVHHDDAPRIRELLQHQDSFLDQTGLLLTSPLVDLDPVVRGRYEHLEYSPLVNARAQKLGAQRRILNDRLARQWTALLEVLRYRAKLTKADRLAIAYYLFLQDRTAEALAMLDAAGQVGGETALQHDYLRVYAEFFRERPAEARAIAERHKDHPVDKWRHLFRNALAQLDEVTGTAPQVVDDKDRDQRQSRAVSSEPDFDFTIEKKAVALNYQNLSAIKVAYYRMDIELLFSRQPFLQQQSDQFSFIRPNRTDEVKLPAGRTHSFELPAEFAGANVVVELVGEGRRKSQAHYANELRVSVVENFGQVRVAHAPTGKPLSKTYVKVYARMQGGQVKFFKDGYTDLRGAFDYASVSTDELDRVERFSLLVLSEGHGSVIREAAPPKR